MKAMVTFRQLLLILSKQYTLHQWKMLHEQNIYYYYYYDDDELNYIYMMLYYCQCIVHEIYIFFFI